MHRIIVGDALVKLSELPPGTARCCMTSPPYWGLRDYGVDRQIGLERTPEEYVTKLVAVFREVRRVLADDGTLWLNLGDCYATGGGAVGRAPGGGDQGERFIRQGMINTQPNRMPIPGLKPKDLVGIPWRVAFALQADGWWLRSEIIWHKPNAMPESVADRPTKAHEQIFLLAKSERYYYNAEAIAEDSIENDNRKPYEPGRVDERGNGHDRGGGSERTNGIREASKRNKRSVWMVATHSFRQAHFATFPPSLIKPCILAGSAVGDTVLDPFAGAGTTGLVASRLHRDFVGIELNPKYAEMARQRIWADAPILNEVICIE